MIADRIAAQAARRSLDYLALLLIPTLLGAMVGLALAFVIPREYEADAVVEMVLHANPYSARDRIGKVGLNREAALLMSPAFLNGALQGLSPQMRARLGKTGNGSGNEVNVAKGPRALNRFHVMPVPFTSLLRLSYRSPDPQFAVDVLNALIPAAQLAAPRARNRQIAGVNVFFDSRLRQVAARIAAEDEQLDQAGRASGGAAHQVVSIRAGTLSRSAIRRLRRGKKRRGFGDGKSASTLEIGDDDADPELQILSREAARAEDTQRNALTRLKHIEALSAAGDRDALEGLGRADTTTTDPYGISALRQRIARAKADYAELSEGLGPEQPRLVEAVARLQALDRELERLDQVFVAAAQAQQQAAVKNRDLTTKALRRQQQIDADLAEDEDRNAILELELGVDLSIYENLRDLMKRRGTDAGMDAPTLDVVDLATMPAIQDPVPWQADMVFGGAGCMVLGGILAAILFVRRQYLWTLGQAERATGLPLMAALPETVAAAKIGDGAYREALRELAGVIAGLHRFAAVRSILFAEVAPQERPGLLAASLAGDLSRSGARVLLVDADLVRANLHTQFGVRGAPGLAEVLSGQATLESVLCPAPGIEGLFLLPAGTQPPIASTLIQSGEMHGLLATLAARFDYVLVNGPPLLTSTDSPFLAERVDFVLLAVSFARTHLKLQRAAAKMLRSARGTHAGLVVEGTPPSTPAGSQQAS